MNVEHFNRIANHADVRRFLGGDGPIELGPIVEDSQNYCFQTAHGGFILWHLGSGRYDVHPLFTPEGRGEEARRAMAQVASYMFARTDCTEGRTTVPRGNRPADVLARRGGFELRFEMERMPWRQGETTAAAFLSLTLERWALTSKDTLAAGRWFHESLEVTKSAVGSARETHADDPVHDRMAGAAVLMILCGQSEKAVAFYNAWALTARYAPIAHVSKRPAVFDIGDAIIEARTDGMEVLRCR